MENKYYYETSAAVQQFKKYNLDKEKSFISFLFERICIPKIGLAVEIGGGAAIHGSLLAQRFGQRYLFTDRSRLFVDVATQVGLRAAQMDGLAMALGGGSAACAVLIGTSTLLGEQETRRQQFRECARILGESGVGIFVTGRWHRKCHFCDDDDSEFLRKLGFSTTWLSWGIIPGRLWRFGHQGLCDGVEKIFSRTNLPARLILLARRCAASPSSF